MSQYSSTYIVITKDEHLLKRCNIIHTAPQRTNKMISAKNVRDVL